MNRRHAIKHLSLAAGSLIALPAWMVSCGMSEANVHPTSFSASQQQLLAAAADAIVPPVSGVGALSTETPAFLQKLFDDCYEEEARSNIKEKLESLETAAKKEHNSSFAKCTLEQRQSLLLKLKESSDKKDNEFFDTIKRETVRGFTTSQKVMQDYLHYKVAPGYYHGCVPVKA